jgi:putative flavoprotein involved in K+ transport
VTDVSVETVGATRADVVEIAGRWLEAFSVALLSGDSDAVSDLLAEDAWWRDLLALSWDLRSFHGRAQIRAALTRHLAQARFTNFRLYGGFTPREQPTPEGAAIQAVFEYEAETHRGRGVVLLMPGDGSSWQATSVSTAMESLVGHEERETTPDALQGPLYRDPVAGRRRWFEQREDAHTFRDREPAVLVIGAGHAGLGVAARLARLGVDTLVVDRNERVGDNWRSRYANLIVHDPYWVNHLPYLPFPNLDWEPMLSKDRLGNWLETYANVLDINVWTKTEVVGGSYDGASGQWSISLRCGDEQKIVRPRYVVAATGLNGRPKLPELDGMDEFAGEIVHSSAFTDAKDHSGIENALVVGTGSSAFDIAQDLFEQRAASHITMLQRSSTYVISTYDGLATLLEAFSGPMPPEDLDLLATATPFPAMIEMNKQFGAPAIAELDRELLEGLERAGFETNLRGLFSSPLEKPNGPYYIDQGGCRLIVDGDVAVKRGSLAGFTRDAAVLADGTKLPADLVVLATGYHGLRETIRDMFGDPVADRIDPILGIDTDRNELSGLWYESGQPGLWVHAGGLGFARLYSRLVALQIKAYELGLLTHEAA